MWQLCDGMPVDDDVRAFARYTDAAPEPVRNNPASVVPDLDPRDLVRTIDHPSRGIGSMIGLLQIIGGVQINVGSVRIHLFAISGRSRPVHGRASIFVVLQQDLSVDATDEVTCRHRVERRIRQTTGSNPRQRPRGAGSF